MSKGHKDKLAKRLEARKRKQCRTCRDYPEIVKELPSILAAAEEAGWVGWDFLRAYLADEYGYELGYASLELHSRNCLGWRRSG